MNNLLTLTKLSIKNQFVPKYKSKQEKNKAIATYSILGVVMLIPLVAICFLIYNVTGLAVQYNNLPYFLSMVLVTSQIMVMFFGLLTYLQIMFFSKDNEFLLTLPVSKTQMYLSKFFTVLLNQIIIAAIVILPTSIVMIIAMLKAGIKVSAAFYVLIPIAIVLIPLLPTLLIALVSFPLSKLLTYFKKKPFLGAIISMALTAGIICAIYIPLYSGGVIGENQSQVDMQSMFAMGKYSYHTLVFAKAMLGMSFAANFFIFLGITIAAFAIGVFISVAFYKKTIESIVEGTGVVIGKSTQNQNAKISTKNLSQTVAYAKKDLKTLFRNTQLSINSFMNLIMAPLMIIIMNIAFKSQGVAVPPEQTFMYESMSLFMSVGLLIMLMFGANTLSMVAFSREGNQLCIMKTLPISIKDVVKSKLLIADGNILIATLLSSIPLFIFCKSNAIDYCGYFIIMPTIGLAINSFAIKRDLKNPNTDWINIKQLFKNNIASFIMIALSFSIAIIFIVCGIVLPMFIKSAYVISAIIWGAALLISSTYLICFRVSLFKNCEQLYNM